MLSGTAWARGFYFHVFPESDAGTELVAETTIVKRCPPELKKDALACGVVDGGHLIAVKEGEGARFKLLGQQGVRWQRVLEGTPVFQDGLFVVLETRMSHRAVWLSPVDGSTTRTTEFIEQSGPAPMKGCDDGVMRWFRSAGGALAAICRVLD